MRVIARRPGERIRECLIETSKPTVETVTGSAYRNTFEVVPLFAVRDWRKLFCSLDLIFWEHDLRQLQIDPQTCSLVFGPSQTTQTRRRWILFLRKWSRAVIGKSFDFPKVKRNCRALQRLLHQEKNARNIYKIVTKWKRTAESEWSSWSDRFLLILPLKNFFFVLWTRSGLKKKETILGEWIDHTNNS